MSGRGQAGDADAARPRRWPLLLALLAIGVAVLVLLWDWNWFLPVAELEASAMLGRPVTMGRFDVRMAAHPTLRFDEVSVANPDGFPESSSFMTVRQVRLRIDPGALLHHRLKIEAMDVDTPRVDLRTNPAGNANWVFPAFVDHVRSWHLSIDELHIVDGAAHFTDPARHADISASFRTTDGGKTGGPTLKVSADGQLAGEPLSGEFSGTSILAADHRAAPDTMSLQLSHGDTHIRLEGTLPAPLAFRDARGTLSLSGTSLAALYALTTVPLPPTPPFELSGKFGVDAAGLDLTQLTGRVGHSDLSGTLHVALGRPRPELTGTLLSKHLTLTDLAGLVGLSPRDGTSTPAQALSDAPIVRPGLRTMDVTLDFQARHVSSSWTPLRQLRAHLRIAGGVLHLKPLVLGIGSGSAAFDITVDDTVTPPRLQADVSLKAIDVASLQPTKPRRNASGIIGGRLYLATTGNSLARMLANGNGGFKLFSTGGPLAPTLAGIGGEAFAQHVLGTLKLGPHTALDCMVADLGLHNGKLSTRHLLATTPAADIHAHGSTDFRTRTLDYRVAVQEHQLRLKTLHPPILINGPVLAPRITAGDVALGKQVAAVALAPLQALVPSAGPHDSAQMRCLALLHETQGAIRQGHKGVVAPLPTTTDDDQ